MADRESTTPRSIRTPKGTLYEKACASCGKISWVDKRRINRPCNACSNRARSTHGLAARGQMHPLYRLLKNMDARCRYPSASHYEYYGGRGIKVCQEWLDDPSAFVAWAIANGWEPGKEIDRRDTNGNYTPDNCRFISHQRNSQTTRRITTTPEQASRVRELLAGGSSIRAAAREAGVSYMVAWHLKNSPGVWNNVE